MESGISVQRTNKASVSGHNEAAAVVIVVTMSSGDAGGEGASGAGGGGSILLNQPIVLDNGTGSIKAGFAGGSKPKVSHWQQARRSMVSDLVKSHKQPFRSIAGRGWCQSGSLQTHAHHAWWCTGTRSGIFGSVVSLCRSKAR